MAHHRPDASFDALPALSDAQRVPPSERSFGRQYAQMYDFRLAVLRKRAKEAAMERHASAAYVDRLLDIPPRQVCVVTGTFFSALRRKPDVLQDIARDLSLPPPPPRTSYVDTEHDELFFEDQSGRVRLVGEAIRPGSDLAHKCVTGVVASIVGIETPDGDLEVRHVYFPGLPPPDAAPTTVTGGRIVLASGLRAGEADPKNDLARELLVEWLTGELDASSRDETRRISSLVLAGDSVQRAAWEHVVDPKHQEPNPFAYMDPLLAQLCESLRAVVVMPGAQDPCSAALPQQPLLRTLLPRSSVHDTLHLCTNPTWFSVHGRRILATSGQNIHDLLKYLPDEAQTTDAALNMAVSTLEWSHIAPTAPDTLWCYPFKATDALVIRAAPDLYIIGNQDAYATKLVHNVRLILVPSFARTHEVVVLDTETLEPHVMSFHT